MQSFCFETLVSFICKQNWGKCREKKGRGALTESSSPPPPTPRLRLLLRQVMPSVSVYQSVTHVPKGFRGPNPGVYFSKQKHFGPEKLFYVHCHAVFLTGNLIINDFENLWKC